MEPIARARHVLGLDVGKHSHWACLATPEGEVAQSRPVDNREGPLDALMASLPPGTLVVVDQARNIGALALERARAAGLEAAYLPGSSVHGASRLFAGEAKTDERDALVIAKTALGIPDALVPVPKADPTLRAARVLASQRDFLVTCAARDRNRLHAVLLESCPAFEAAAALSSAALLRLLAEAGSPWRIADGGKELLEGVPHAEALWEALEGSTRPDEEVVEAEAASVRLLAGRAAEALAEARGLSRRISALLAGNDTYRCLLTVPGIGPSTAAELVIAIDIARFPDHDRLASYCGLAPRNRRSGTSVSSVSASRHGNKRLKSLLIFTCNCLIAGTGPYAEHYRACRERGMPHGKALKATARKRLKVIYAVMRDKEPYRA